MPIFEYECAKCKKVFELLILGGSQETVKCPSCSSKRVRKLLSSFSVGKGAAGSSSSKSSGACTTCSTKNCSTCS